MWPKIREGAISAWHAILDYDRKRSLAEKEEIQDRRATARNIRLAGDGVRERRRVKVAALRDEIATERGAIKRATDSLDVIHPEVLPPHINGPATPAPYQQPQVVYIQTSHPQQPQTVVVKSMGCADGCVIVIAIVLLVIGAIVFLPILLMAN